MLSLENSFQLDPGEQHKLDPHHPPQFKA